MTGARATSLTRSLDMKKCASLQSAYWFTTYSPATKTSEPWTCTLRIVSVRFVVNLKNSLPFLLKPRTWPALLANSLSPCSGVAPRVRHVIASGPGAVLNTELRSSSFLRMPNAWTTPSQSPRAILFWRLPLLRGRTHIVPRSAWDVCVTSVLLNVSDMVERAGATRERGADARRTDDARTEISRAARCPGSSRAARRGPPAGGARGHGSRAAPEPRRAREGARPRGGPRSRSRAGRRRADEWRRRGTQKRFEPRKRHVSAC